MRITDAVWVILLLGRGFSLIQIGIAEGLFHLVSFLCEVPTGMIADLFGRKRTLFASSLCGVIATLTMAFSFDFFGVCLSMTFKAFMYNLCSGTQEAITYDSLKMAGMEDSFLKKNAWLVGLMQTSSALSCILGGVAALVGAFYAYIFDAILAAICAFSALLLQEPLVTENQKQRTAHPFSGLGQRFKKHVVDSVTFLVKSPRTSCKIFASAASGVPIYLTFMYLQQHLLSGGLSPAFLGVALLLIRLGGIAGTILGSRLKIRLYHCVIACAMISGLGTILAGSSWWMIALLGGMISHLTDSIIALHSGAAVNKDFPSDQRATLVSVDSMTYSLLMIVASPISGTIGDTLGTGWTLGVLGIALIIAAPVLGGIYQAVLRRRN